MSDFVHLVGTEGVQSAAHQIAAAAQTMARAASALDECLQRHLNRFEELVQRLEAVAAEAIVSLPDAEAAPERQALIQWLRDLRPAVLEAHGEASASLIDALARDVEAGDHRKGATDA